MKNIIKFILLFVPVVIISSCSNSSNRHEIKNADNENSLQNGDESKTITAYPQIGDAFGRDTIIGNFTGVSQDTLYVEEFLFKDGEYEDTDYRIVSKNSKLPIIETSGKPAQIAFIVNEGDLDEDGKDELGWMRCSFKSEADAEYHLLKFNDGKWEELVDENKNPYIFTGTDRNSKIDLFSKGEVKGSIIIRHKIWPTEPGEMIETTDTIYKPLWK